MWVKYVKTAKHHTFYLKNSGHVPCKANFCTTLLSVALFDSVLRCCSQRGFFSECLGWSHDGGEAAVAFLCSPLSCYTCSRAWGSDTKGAVLLRSFTPRLRFSECFCNPSCRGLSWKQTLRPDGFSARCHGLTTPSAGNFSADYPSVVFETDLEPLRSNLKLITKIRCVDIAWEVIFIYFIICTCRST